jgi:hypothetical protein
MKETTPSGNDKTPRPGQNMPGNMGGRRSGGVRVFAVTTGHFPGPVPEDSGGRPPPAKSGTRLLPKGFWQTESSWRSFRQASAESFFSVIPYLLGH